MLKMQLELAAVDAVRDAHMILEVVAVLEGVAADSAGLPVLLLVRVDVLNVPLEAAAVQKLAAVHARRLVAWNTSEGRCKTCLRLEIVA